MPVFCEKILSSFSHNKPNQQQQRFLHEYIFARKKWNKNKQKSYICIKTKTKKCFNKKKFIRFTLHGTNEDETLKKETS